MSLHANIHLDGTQPVVRLLNTNGHPHVMVGLVDHEQAILHSQNPAELVVLADALKDAARILADALDDLPVSA